MKKTHKIVGCAVSWLFVLFMAVSPGVFAQDQGSKEKFTQEELDQMLAPIALYPDSLLAQVLMASTYPLEVVMADRWVKENKGQQGDQLNAELDKQDWDPSVKALVPFPQVLAMMSEQLEWTEKLGDAFLDQQDAVMETIQRLRQKAQETGNLKSGSEQKVITQGNTIIIEPVNPEVIYVPVYNPFIVYGPWWYPAYPPFWYYPPGYATVGFAFYFPFFCVVDPFWHHGWGHWDWHHHRVYVNVHRHRDMHSPHTGHAYVRTDRWHHDGRHRRGVSYRNEATHARFGQTRRGSEEHRGVFRGFRSGPRMARQFQGGSQTVPQHRGSIGIGHGGPRGTNRTIFGGVGRGSDVRRQGVRSFQGGGGISSWGGAGRGPRSGGFGGGGHGGGNYGGGRGDHGGGGYGGGGGRHR